MTSTKGVARKCNSGGQAHKHPSHYPKNVGSFCSDFRHFILKMLENAKLSLGVPKQNIGTEISGETVTADFSTAGRRLLVHFFDVHGPCPGPLGHTS